MQTAKALLAVLILGCLVAVRPNTSDFLDSAEPSSRQEMRWPTKTIRISLSTSLSSPGSAIKPGSDVLGAVHRALDRWSIASGITFEETSSKLQSISPANSGDGISLITIGDTPENLAIFGTGYNPARTRVFYDPSTSEISEADIALNPRAAQADSTPQFSTDGTPGTYDLESTLTHEIGHLLGLEHSKVVASTMQARQAVNGVYKLPAFTERTLSEDDRARISGLYGSGESLTAIEGKLTISSFGGSPIPLPGAHVWLEESVSGRLIASGITSLAGNYRVQNIPPGQYRVFTEYLESAVVPEVFPQAVSASRTRAFRSAEISNRVSVGANATTTVNFVLVPPQSAPPSLKPNLIGTNGELSTTPLLGEAGKKLTIYVGGEGVDQVPVSGISVMSPFMTIDAESLTLQQFSTSFPVISFDVTVAANTSFGDYSIRLQSNSGEVAYVPGAITVDPGVTSSSPNPVDDPRFFVSQHYRDFLGREADPAKIDSWVSVFEQCGSDADCLSARRLDVSTAFLESEFEESWFFIYRLYKAAFGRRPTLSEFNSDRREIASDGADIEDAKRAFARAFVRRPEFTRKYSISLKGDQFVDRVLASIMRTSEVDLASERANLAAFHDGTRTGQAEILQHAVTNASFARAEQPRAFVLLHYFGFLRREPDEGGYKFWLNTISSRATPDPMAYRAILCAFITSAEYQSRFGMFVTHSNKECKL
ncbi:MAG: DUF4214 domain-containing protein [Pyrinomonadaceae bacterium]